MKWETILILLIQHVFNSQRSVKSCLSPDLLSGRSPDFPRMFAHIWLVVNSENHNMLKDFRILIKLHEHVWRTFLKILCVRGLLPRIVFHKPIFCMSSSSNVHACNEQCECAWPRSRRSLAASPRAPVCVRGRARASLRSPLSLRKHFREE